MKPIFLAFICITVSALAQEKPRVFVQGKGSQDVTTSSGRWASSSTIDSHDESMEVTKNLQKDCAAVTVTLVQSNADYTVLLNRESKHNRGLLRTNSQIQVANRLGDIIGTNATRTVGNASKDACQLILADWTQHGRMPVPDSPTSAQETAPAAPATAPALAEEAKVQTVSAIESQHTTAVAATTTVTKTDNLGTNPASAGSDASGPVRMGEATAEISSTPSGADIEIDGGFVGSTPSSVGIAAGEHTLRISKNGYKPWERALRSSTGNIKIAAALEVTSAANLSTENQSSPFVPNAAILKGNSPTIAVTSVIRNPEPVANSPASQPEEDLIGVRFTGNPTVRHDGVEISGVQPNGPADNIDIKAGDVLLAIDARYLFTIDEVRADLLRYKPGARLLIRYRRNQFISENYLVVGGKDSIPQR